MRGAVGTDSQMEFTFSTEIGNPFVTGRNVIAGAELSVLDEGLSTFFGVSEGILVTNVLDETPAAEAGLRGGDVILTVNGEIPTEVDDVRRHLEADGPATLLLFRKGQRIRIQLQE